MSPNTTPKINILEYRFEAQRGKQQRAMEWLIYLIILVVLAGAAAGVAIYQKSRLAFLQLENQALQQQRQQLTQKASGGAGNGETRLVERQGILDKLKQNKVSYRETVEAIDLQALPDIHLAKVGVKKDEISVSGYSDGQDQLIDYTERLLKLPGVKGVKSVDSQLNDKTGEVTFTLVLRWEVAK